VEVELRSKLADRDERITELKQQAAAANRAAALLQRSKSSSATGRTPGPPAAALGLVAEEGAAGGAGRVPSAAAAGKDYLVQQIADLRVALAKRNAEVARLEQQVAVATVNAPSSSGKHRQQQQQQEQQRADGSAASHSARGSRQGSMSKRAAAADALMAAHWDSLEAAAADAPLLAGQLTGLQDEVAAAAGTAHQLVQLMATALGREAAAEGQGLAAELDALAGQVHAVVDQLQQLQQQRAEEPRPLQPQTTGTSSAAKAWGAAARPGFSAQPSWGAESSQIGCASGSSLRSTPRQQSLAAGVEQGRAGSRQLAADNSRVSGACNRAFVTAMPCTAAGMPLLLACTGG
jgi:hypothetical protein